MAAPPPESSPAADSNPPEATAKAAATETADVETAQADLDSADAETAQADAADAETAQADTADAQTAQADTADADAKAAAAETAEVTEDADEVSQVTPPDKSDKSEGGRTATDNGPTLVETEPLTEPIASEPPTKPLATEEPTKPLVDQESPARPLVDEEEAPTKPLLTPDPTVQEPLALALPPRNAPPPVAPAIPATATPAEAQSAAQPPTEQPPTKQPPADQSPTEAPPQVGELAEALSHLRAAIGASAYPLVMPSADEARRIGKALVSQIDDYLLPRLARLDAPLLVVVGGSTGAGKSTLVNSLVRAPVSAAGVLRPTTRSPVLVGHPDDMPWFRKGELLPGLVRTTVSSSDPRTLQLVTAPALGPGLAFLDAPDIDSVVEGNRKLAAQLLAAADLWLFVTTAARYADAVPWELLTTARLRGTVIALVLDRVPAEAAGEISAHLREMLGEHDMAAAPLFVLPEVQLGGQALLPEDVTRPLHDWFEKLAADATARSAVVRQTLDGALAALGPAVDGLADAADDQSMAASALDERVTAAYRTAKRTVADGLQDGRLLRGEVLARWQEFVGTGEFLRSLESRVGHLRDRVVAALTGRPAPGRNLQHALESQLVTLLRGVSSDAAEQAFAAWQAHPAGSALLEPPLQKPSGDLPARADRLVRDWQHWVLELVREEAGDKRFVARAGAYAVNGVGLAVMIAVFTSTAFIPTGAEVAVGAGTTIAAQKLLEAIFGDQAIRTLASRARENLMSRVDELLDAEAARFTDRTAAAGLELEPGGALRQAAAEVERARNELALTTAGDG